MTTKVFRNFQVHFQHPHGASIRFYNYAEDLARDIANDREGLGIEVIEFDSGRIIDRWAVKPWRA